MKFLYDSIKTVKRPITITDAVRVDAIKLYGNTVEVDMDDEYIADFFGKPIEKLTVDDVIDYAEGGLPDSIHDAFNDHDIDIDVSTLKFNTIEL